MDSSTFYVVYIPTERDWLSVVQVVGPILGILIAILIPYITHRFATKLRSDERRRKGHAVAVLLRSEVEAWYRCFDRQNIPSLSEPVHVTHLVGAMDSIDREQALVIPQRISDSARELEYLERAGEFLLQCMYKNHELARTRLKIVKELKKAPSNDERLQELARAFFPAYGNQIDMLENALVGITNRFDLGAHLAGEAIEADQRPRASL